MERRCEPGASARSWGVWLLENKGSVSVMVWSPSHQQAGQCTSAWLSCQSSLACWPVCYGEEGNTCRQARLFQHQIKLSPAPSSEECTTQSPWMQIFVRLCERVSWSAIYFHCRNQIGVEIKWIWVNWLHALRNRACCFIQVPRLRIQMIVLKSDYFSVEVDYMHKAYQYIHWFGTEKCSFHKLVWILSFELIQ